MHRLPERFVHDGEEDRQNEEEGEDDPGHPCKCDEGGEKAAGRELATPVEVAPEVLCEWNWSVF
jgi:hypothetical protein